MTDASPYAWLDHMTGTGAPDEVRSGGGAEEGPEPPELVIGLVSPLGAPAQQVIDALNSSLGAFSYSTSIIKISKLLQDHAARLDLHVEDVDGEPEHKRVETLMNLGDQICARHENAATALALAIDEISTVRIERQGSDVGSPLSRHAWVVDSLKRPAEVTALREVYGDHAIIVSIDAPKSSRVDTIFNRVKPTVPMMNDPDIRLIAEQLLSRDQSGTSGPYGQDVVKTFPLADVFVQSNSDVDRFVRLLFGDPEHPGPTSEEHGMQLASVAATRSPELGLKVGAALMTDEDVVALGANAHPTTPKESPAFDASKIEIEKLVGETLEHLSDAGILTTEASDAIEANPNGWVKELLLGPLKGASIRNLTEFQQTVHAEMAALLSALKQGRSVTGAHMYVTAYPCHNCAKHLLRLGIDVTYLEPYPKSLTESMYEIGSSQFAPYIGVAPRRFMEWFVSTEDRKSPDGTRLTWTEADRAEAIPVVDRYVNHDGILEREAWFVQTARLDRAGAEHADLPPSRDGGQRPDTVSALGQDAGIDPNAGTTDE